MNEKEQIKKCKDFQSQTKMTIDFTPKGIICFNDYLFYIMVIQSNFIQKKVVLFFK